MVLVGVYHHVVELARAVQRTAHLHGVLEMHIVVGRAVYDQKTRRRAQTVGEVDRRVVVVAGGVILRQIVVYLGIDAVVIAP